MRISAIFAALALLISVNASKASQGIVGFTYSSWGIGQGTSGWSFHPDTDISVNALGCLEYLFGAQGQDQFSVGLWDAGGSLLASTSVGISSPLVSDSRYEAINPVTLLAGNTYRVGLHSPKGGFGLYAAVPFDGGSVQTSPEIQLETAVLNPSGFAFPNGELGGPGAALLTANFSYTLVPVPEPSALALSAFGLVTLAAFSRRKR